MGDALPVRRVRRIRDLDSDLERLIERQRALLQPLGQRLPVEILHDQEVHEQRLRRPWVTGGGAPGAPLSLWERVGVRAAWDCPVALVSGSGQLAVGRLGEVHAAAEGG